MFKISDDRANNWQQLLQFHINSLIKNTKDYLAIDLKESGFCEGKQRKKTCKIPAKTHDLLSDL